MGVDESGLSRLGGQSRLGDSSEPSTAMTSVGMSTTSTQSTLVHLRPAHTPNAGACRMADPGLSSISGSSDVPFR